RRWESSSLRRCSARALHSKPQCSSKLRQTPALPNRHLLRAQLPPQFPASQPPPANRFRSPTKISVGRCSNRFARYPSRSPPRHIHIESCERRHYIRAFCTTRDFPPCFLIEIGRAATMGRKNSVLSPAVAPESHSAPESTLAPPTPSPAVASYSGS